VYGEKYCGASADIVYRKLASPRGSMYCNLWRVSASWRSNIVALILLVSIGVLSMWQRLAMTAINGSCVAD